VAVPSGTVTFLFTDTEGSTRLWQAAPDAMRQGLERHDAILRATVKPSQVKLGGEAIPFTDGPPVAITVPTPVDWLIVSKSPPSVAPKSVP